jgi:hypothetical protein
MPVVSGKGDFRCVSGGGWVWRCPIKAGPYQLSAPMSPVCPTFRFPRFKFPSQSSPIVFFESYLLIFFFFYTPWGRVSHTTSINRSPLDVRFHGGPGPYPSHTPTQSGTCHKSPFSGRTAISMGDVRAFQKITNIMGRASARSLTNL